MTEWTNATGSGAEPLFFLFFSSPFLRSWKTATQGTGTALLRALYLQEAPCTLGVSATKKISILAFAETSILSAASWKHFSYRRDSVELGSDSTFRTSGPCSSTHSHIGRATMSSLSRQTNPAQLSYISILGSLLRKGARLPTSTYPPLTLATTLQLLAANEEKYSLLFFVSTTCRPVVRILRLRFVSWQQHMFSVPLCCFFIFVCARTQSWRKLAARRRCSLLWSQGWIDR